MHTDGLKGQNTQGAVQPAVQHWAFVRNPCRVVVNRDNPFQEVTTPFLSMSANTMKFDFQMIPCRFVTILCARRHHADSKIGETDLCITLAARQADSDLGCGDIPPGNAMLLRH